MEITVKTININKEIKDVKVSVLRKRMVENVVIKRITHNASIEGKEIS